MTARNTPPRSSGAAILREGDRGAGGSTAGEAGAIEVRGEGRDDLVVISVIDQGPGIPDNQLDRIFDPFYRLEDDRARETGGTGLGLAIVRTCVEAGGGRVTAHNHHPGFEIRIELPRP